MQNTACRNTIAAAAARATFERGESKASAKRPPMKVRRKGNAQSKGVERMPVVFRKTSTTKQSSGVVLPK